MLQGALEAEVIPYALPFAAPYVTARGVLAQREMVLLRLRDEDGFTGLGEAVPLSLRGGTGIDEVVRQLETWGHSPQIELSAPARCAVETALLDLESRRAGVAAWQQLGAMSFEPLRCNATVVAGPPAAVVADATGWAQDGFRSFKLKAGTADDVAALGAVAKALDEDIELRVDANGAWTTAEAIEKLREMGAAGAAVAEQPCPTLEEMAALRDQTEVLLAADESVSGAVDAAQARELGACDLITVKLSKVGGPRAALDSARALPTYLSSALDGPVGIAAAAHTAQALRDSEATRDAGIPQGLATQRLFTATIAERGPELDGEKLSVPPGPGLAVEIDPAALERHRL